MMGPGADFDILTGYGWQNKGVETFRRSTLLCWAARRQCDVKIRQGAQTSGAQWEEGQNRLVRRSTHRSRFVGRAASAWQIRGPRTRYRSDDLPSSGRDMKRRRYLEQITDGAHLVMSWSKSKHRASPRTRVNHCWLQLVAHCLPNPPGPDILCPDAGIDFATIDSATKLSRR